MALEPAVEQLLHLSSEVLTAKAQVKRQQAVIWALVAALRSSQQAQVAMADLLDQVLAGDA